MDPAANPEAAAPPANISSLADLPAYKRIMDLAPLQPILFTTHYRDEDGVTLLRPTATVERRLLETFAPSLCPDNNPGESVYIEGKADFLQVAAVCKFLQCAELDWKELHCLMLLCKDEVLSRECIVPAQWEKFFAEYLDGSEREILSRLEDCTYCGPGLHSALVPRGDDGPFSMNKIVVLGYHWSEEDNQTVGDLHYVHYVEAVLMVAQIVSLHGLQDHQEPLCLHFRQMMGKYWVFWGVENIRQLLEASKSRPWMQTHICGFLPVGIDFREHWDNQLLPCLLKVCIASRSLCSVLHWLRDMKLARPAFPDGEGDVQDFVLAYWEDVKASFATLCFSFTNSAHVQEGYQISRLPDDFVPARQHKCGLSDTHLERLRNRLDEMSITPRFQVEIVQDYVRQLLDGARRMDNPRWGVVNGFTCKFFQETLLLLNMEQRHENDTVCRAIWEEVKDTYVSRDNFTPFVPDPDAPLEDYKNIFKEAKGLNQKRKKKQWVWKAFQSIFGKCKFNFYPGKIPLNNPLSPICVMESEKFAWTFRVLSLWKDNHQMQGDHMDVLFPQRYLPPLHHSQIVALLEREFPCQGREKVYNMQGRGEIG